MYETSKEIVSVLYDTASRISAEVLELVKMDLLKYGLFVIGMDKQVTFNEAAALNSIIGTRLSVDEIVDLYKSVSWHMYRNTVPGMFEVFFAADKASDKPLRYTDSLTEHITKMYITIGLDLAQSDGLSKDEVNQLHDFIQFVESSMKQKFYSALS